MKTLKQTSTYTGIGYEALRQRVKRGTLKTEKIGVQHFLTDDQVRTLQEEKQKKGYEHLERVHTKVVVYDAKTGVEY